MTRLLLFLVLAGLMFLAQAGVWYALGYSVEKANDAERWKPEDMPDPEPLPLPRETPLI